MSWIRYAIAAGMLVSTLWAQSPAPPATSSKAPEPPAAQAKTPDASGNAAAVPPPATPPPDSMVLVVTKKVKPDYPAAALPDKLQGQVVVRVVVNEEGDVENAEAISGNPVLAQAAVDAVKQWKFKPFIKNGQPVKAGLKLPFDFAPPADVPPAAPPLPAALNGILTEPPAPARPAAPQTIRVSSGVTQGLMLHKVDPVYPAAAKQAGVQGSVVLGAIISTEGTIKDLHVISGDALLSPAAIDAVKKWRYKPYLLKGEPVEVQTTVVVNFRLSVSQYPRPQEPRFPSGPGSTMAPSPSVTNRQ